MGGDIGDSDFDEPLQMQQFIPNAAGVEHVLSDKVVMLVRMEYMPRKGKYVTQWYLPDRRIVIPDDLCMYKAAEHLVEFMKSRPKMTIGIDMGVWWSGTVHNIDVRRHIYSLTVRSRGVRDSRVVMLDRCQLLNLNIS